MKQALEKFNFYTSMAFLHSQDVYRPASSMLCQEQKPISSFELVIDSQESPHFTLRVSCNKNKPGPMWIRVSVTREAISFIFSLINTAAFSD